MLSHSLIHTHTYIYTHTHTHTPYLLAGKTHVNVGRYLKINRFKLWISGNEFSPDICSSPNYQVIFKISYVFRSLLNHNILSLLLKTLLRQTISLYHNSTVWLDMQDSSSWDRNLSNFTLDLVSYNSAIYRVSQNRCIPLMIMIYYWDMCSGGHLEHVL